jgi:hypothetical protein
MDHLVLLIIIKDISIERQYHPALKNADAIVETVITTNNINIKPIIAMINDK